jgi:predicted GIY-YIG superfamily endonuclease
VMRVRTEHRELDLPARTKYVKPEQYFVYGLVDRGGLTFYVGSTTNLLVRLNAHKMQRQDYDSYWYIELRDKAEMLTEEHKIMRYLMPRESFQTPGTSKMQATGSQVARIKELNNAPVPDSFWYGLTKLSAERYIRKLERQRELLGGS